MQNKRSVLKQKMLWKTLQVVAAMLCVLTLNSSVFAVRGRPHLDTGLGCNVLLSDNNTLLRGVSLSWDGGDPYGSQPKVMPSQASLNALATDYGLNTVHLYLEGDSSGNTNPVGYNAADCDILVQRCANAGLYLIITIGCNGENGTIYDMSWCIDFWNFYGARYKDETHVIYEAHNEPVAFTVNHWTTPDWNNQVTFYNTIRTAAPDTFILLGSFMGFVGGAAAKNGADYLVTQGVSWSNTGFAYHGYESLSGIETTVRALKINTSYPAVLCTEFYPGDTDAQGYNSAFESQFTGWMQFQWLGANNADLFNFQSKINSAGTIWTPDYNDCNWPARGTLNIPDNNSIVGIFARSESKFVSADPVDSNNLKAKLANYTGLQNDEFMIEHVGSRLVAFKAMSNDKYVRTRANGDSLTAYKLTVDNTEKFEWLRLANGDIALRAYGGKGHLVSTDPVSGILYSNADNGNDPTANYVTLDAPGGPPPPHPLPVGDPYYGSPFILPTVVQAEDFDLGGESVAYHDNTAGNTGGQYRTSEGVDIENCSDAGGGYNVGWIEADEWIEYTIDVATAGGDYTLGVRFATQSSGGYFHVEFGGVDKTGSVAVPNTGGWQSWTTVSVPVTLNTGAQIMRFARDAGADYNLNKFTFTYNGGNGDLDIDGDVDLKDYSMFSQNWPQTGCGSCGGSDLTGDGNADLDDLASLCSNWQAGI